MFSQILCDNSSREADFLCERLITKKLVNPDDVIKYPKLYFAHYLNDEKIDQMKNFPGYGLSFSEYEELFKNDFELHKKYVKEGHNPNEIAKVIRNDEIEKLQEISSQTNFNFNQTIEPSFYERNSFIDQWNATLIDYAAFFGSVKCFKFLLMNGADVTNTGKYAIASGNIETIHLCEQNHSSFKGGYEAAIKFHHNDVVHYIFQNKLEKKEKLNANGKKCIWYNNFEILSFFEEKKMKIDESFINYSAEQGNLFLVFHFLQGNQLPKSILYSAAHSGNSELIKYMLEQEGVNINGEKNYIIYLMFTLLKSNLIKIFLSPLMIASIYGYTDIAKLLLEQEGININAQDILLFYLQLFVLII